MKALKVIFTFSLLSLTLVSIAQTTYFVSTIGIAPYNGLSWQNAFPSLHDALNIAKASDQIFVREGVYKPHNNDRSKYYNLPVGVSLYGGFKGNETSLDQRIGGATILSGNIGDQLDSTDNSYTILYMQYPDTLNNVDGITFEDGFAKTDTVTDILRPELAGAGVFIYGQNGIALARFQNCTFNRNYAKGAGGAVFVYGDSVSIELNVQFTNCTFIDNRSDMTGAALQAGYHTGRPVVFENCIFTSTKAPFNVRSGVHMRFYKNTELKFLNCSFTSLKTFGNVFLYAIDTFKVTFDSCNLSNWAGRGLFSQQFAHGLLNFDFNMQNCLIEKDTTAQLFYYDFIISNAIGKFSCHIYNNIFRDNLFSFNYLPIPWNFLFQNSRFIYFANNQFQNDFNYLPDVQKYNTLTSTYLYVANNYFKTYDAPFPWFGHFENNIFGSSKPSPYSVVRASESLVFKNNLVYNFSGLNRQPANSGGNYSDTIENNVFIQCYDSSNANAIPYYPAQQNQGSVRHNYTDIPCSQLPNSFNCQQFEYISNLEYQFENLALEDFRLVECSNLINKGINSTHSLVDYYGNPRIIDDRIDIGPTETESISTDTMVIVNGTCTNTGSFECFAPNACGSVTYTWLRSDGQIGTGNTQLHAGEYSVTAHDTLGRSIDFAVVIPSLSFNMVAQTTDVNCQSAMPGSANLILTSGLAPFQFQWSDGYTTNQMNRSGMQAGNYRVTATDAKMCEAQLELEIIASGSLTLLLDANAITCYGDSNGSITASPLNGASPFSWQWNTSDTTKTLLNRSAGNYAVTVTDALGCTKTLAFSLFQPDSLMILASTTNNSSAVLPNGQIQLTSVLGGTAPYRFLWNTSDTTAYLEQLDAGTYTLTLTDANGCTYIQRFVVQGVVQNDGILKNLQVNVQPNPVSNQLLVQLTEHSEFDWTITIFDMHGKQLFFKQMPNFYSSTQIPIATFAHGTYLLMITSNNEVVWRERILVIKD
jgi:Secretion system C-terminal sorting domain/SprB repeat